jgi:hypothetical protein
MITTVRWLSFHTTQNILYHLPPILRSVWYIHELLFNIELFVCILSSFLSNLIIANKDIFFLRRVEVFLVDILLSRSF